MTSMIARFVPMAMLTAMGACSSDVTGPADGDASVSDVSRDGAAPNDTPSRDTAGGDASLIDGVVADAFSDITREATPGDAPSDASAADRAPTDGLPPDLPRTDAFSADGATGDALDDGPGSDTTSDAPNVDVTSDALADTASIDALSPDANPSCPPSYSGATGMCAAPSRCVYPEGACDCLSGCGAPLPPDAGRHWFCGMRGAGCPLQKPTTGTPCSMDAQTCNYGSCCTDQMVCENGAWKQGIILCPP